MPKQPRATAAIIMLMIFCGIRPGWARLDQTFGAKAIDQRPEQYATLDQLIEMARAQFTVGNQMEKQGNLNAAMMAYQAAVAYIPNYPEALAGLERLGGKVKVALPHATPEESRPASALSIREEPAVLIPATEGAGNSLRRRLEKDYLQGKTALDHEEYPRALVAFTAVLELDPNHRDARNSLLETKRKMQRGILDYEGRWRTAQKKQALVDEMFALREILKLNPNHPQARAAWEKAREPNSPVIDQLYRIGVNAYAKKEYLLAQQAWDLLLDLNSYHKKAQESLARVEEKLQIINQQ